MCLCVYMKRRGGGHLACDNNPGKTPIPSEEEGAEGEGGGEGEGGCSLCV